jgi:hypothetical protein
VTKREKSGLKNGRNGPKAAKIDQKVKNVARKIGILDRLSLKSIAKFHGVGFKK